MVKVIVSGTPNGCGRANLGLMDFFEPPPQSPAERGESMRPPPMPAWAGPPEGVLPGTVAFDDLIYRDERAVVAFAGAHAYPEGCQFHLQTWLRSGEDGEDALWSELEDALFRRHRGRARARSADELARFGVQYSDGTKATTPHDPARGGEPPWEQETPHPPVLRHQGPSSSGRGDREDDVRAQHSLWLWPLPPAERFDFVAEWRALGIPLTRVPIDGTAIREAATRSGPVWPEQVGCT